MASRLGSLSYHSVFIDCYACNALLCTTQTSVVNAFDSEQNTRNFWLFTSFISLCLLHHPTSWELVGYETHIFKPFLLSSSYPNHLIPHALFLRRNLIYSLVLFTMKDPIGISTRKKHIRLSATHATTSIFLSILDLQFGRETAANSFV